MANFADNALLKAQTQIQEKFQSPEMRVKTNGSFTPFLRNTQFTIPNITDLRVAAARPVEVNFLTRSKNATGSAKSSRHTGGQGDGGKVLLDFTQYVSTGSTSIKLSENSVFSDTQIIANEIEGMMMNIAEDVHVASLAYLDANKSGVNSANKNGAFEATNDVFEVDIAKKDRFFQMTKSMLGQNFHKGGYDAVLDSDLYAQMLYAGSQGGGNATNLGFQFQGGNFNEAIGLTDANYENGVGFFIPEGTIGVVDWSEPKNRENWGELDSYVGGFRTIYNPYLGVDCALSAYIDRADRTAVGGNVQDVVIQWEITADLALVKAPISVADETTIFAAGIATT